MTISAFVNKHLKDKTPTELFAFLFIGIGVVLLAGALWKFNGNYSISGSINPDISAKFGDFVGGVAGAIWTLAGVLLFWSALKVQRSELEKYKEELQSQRLELATSRATDVVYRQISLMREALNTVNLTFGNSKLIGEQAINVASTFATSIIKNKAHIHDLNEKEGKASRTTHHPSQNTNDQMRSLSLLLKSAEIPQYFSEITRLINTVDDQLSQLKKSGVNETDRGHIESLNNILENNIISNFRGVCENLIDYCGSEPGVHNCKREFYYTQRMIIKALTQYNEFSGE